MAARPGCILPEGSWGGSCLNRPAKGVICVPSAEHYWVVKEDVKPSHNHSYILPTVALCCLKNKWWRTTTVLFQHETSWRSCSPIKDAKFDTNTSVEFESQGRSINKGVDEDDITTNGKFMDKVVKEVPDLKDQTAKLYSIVFGLRKMKDLSKIFKVFEVSWGDRRWLTHFFVRSFEARLPEHHFLNFYACSSETHVQHWSWVVPYKIMRFAIQSEELLWKNKFRMDFIKT